MKVSEVFAESIIGGRPKKQKLPAVAFIISGDFAGLKAYPQAMGLMNGKDLTLCRVEMKDGYYLLATSDLRKA